jgi:hypothetical protein
MYGDGGFWFTQPVNNGYGSLRSFGAPLVITPGAAAAATAPAPRVARIRTSGPTYSPGGAPATRVLRQGFITHSGPSPGTVTTSSGDAGTGTTDAGTGTTDAGDDTPGLTYEDTSISLADSLAAGSAGSVGTFTPSGAADLEDPYVLTDLALAEEGGMVGKARQWAMDNKMMAGVAALGLTYGGYRLYTKYRK